MPTFKLLIINNKVQPLRRAIFLPKVLHFLKLNIVNLFLGSPARINKPISNAKIKNGFGETS